MQTTRSWHEIRSTADGMLHAGSKRWPCIFGTGGLTQKKQEGDGATPVGQFRLGPVFWRADRVPEPVTRLPKYVIRPDMGWCDDPDDALYNHLIRKPYAGRHECLARQDHAYDVLMVIRYNMDQTVPHAGSAIFLHVAQPDGRKTEGCIALACADVLAVIAGCGPETILNISDEEH